MDATQIVVAVIAALSGGGAVVKLVEGVINQRSGRYERERQANADILAMRDHAVADAREAECARRAAEAAYRAERDRIEQEHRIELRTLEAELRVISYHAQLLTRLLIEHGADPASIPRWPIPDRQD